MLMYVDGNLFLSPAKVLVNTVNTVGVMGKGIAKDFKYIFPEMFSEYQLRCESKQLSVGRLFLYKSPIKWVLNFPTKIHWRNPSKLEYIEAGLRIFSAGYERSGITSIAFPRLGCGNGELDWDKQVKPLMESYLGKLPIEIFVHHYWLKSHQLEHHDLQKTKSWLQSEPENLAFEEVWDDIVDMIQKDSTFSDLTRQSSFKITIIHEPEHGLQVTDGQDYFIPKDALLEVWQHIRSAGFVSASSLVEGLDCHAGQVMALFAKLPYIRSTHVAQFGMSNKKDFQYALQYVPRPARNAKLTDPHQAMPA